SSDLWNASPPQLHALWQAACDAWCSWLPWFGKWPKSNFLGHFLLSGNLRRFNFLRRFLARGNCARTNFFAQFLLIMLTRCTLSLLCQPQLGVLLFFDCHHTVHPAIKTDAPSTNEQPLLIGPIARVKTQRILQGAHINSAAECNHEIMIDAKR